MTTPTAPHIAFLHKDFPWSGAEQVTIDVANYLCAKGFRVTVLATGYHEEKFHEGTQRLFTVETLPPGDPKSSRDVRQAVAHFIGEQGVGVLVTYRQLHYAAWLRRTTGVRIVYELHNTPYYEFLDVADKKRESVLARLFYGCGVEWIMRRLFRRKYRSIYRAADAYGVLCEGYRQMLVDELRLDAAHNKLWVLPNPITPPPAVSMAKEKVVLYVGRLSHRDKRVDRLLRVWQLASRQLSDWRLLIVGDGRAADGLKRLAQQLQLPRCSFEGRTSRVQDYYDRAAILCLTSSFEGWPMSVAEAQANGVVPIVFDSFAGAADLIATPDEGILVPPYDEPLFARELVALATDAPRLERLRQTVIAKSLTYSVERSGQAWERMLGKVL